MFYAKGEWNDGHCSVRIPSVCEKDPAQKGPITTTLPPHIDGFCPSGKTFTPYGLTRCYWWILTYGFISLILVVIICFIVRLRSNVFEVVVFTNMIQLYFRYRLHGF